MIVTEELAPSLAADVERPSTRTIALPHGPSADDRSALLQAIAEPLLEIRVWPSAWEVGDSSHLFETRLRLRSVEREIGWAGAVPCGGPLAWLCGALAGAPPTRQRSEVEAD